MVDILLTGGYVGVGRSGGRGDIGNNALLAAGLVFYEHGLENVSAGTGGDVATAEVVPANNRARVIALIIVVGISLGFRPPK